jgi:DNA repair exonuclease SbcCD ATPase subunit
MKLTRFHSKWLFSLGEIDLDLKDRGLLLITGHSLDEGGANGSGKSSLSNKGLLWTLFGATASGDKADAVVNRFRPEGEETFGSVEFESASGGRFRIYRSRNPNRLLFYDLDGPKNISTTSEKDTQALINRTLGRNRETFLQTDFFGQGKASSFLDLTPKGQMELLENILPFERLSELHDKTKIYLSQVKVAADKYQRKASETQGQVLETQRQDRVLSDSVDKWEIDQANTIEDLVRQLEMLQVTGEVAARIRELDAMLEGMENPIELHREIGGVEDKIAELEPYQHTYNRLINECSVALDNLKAVPAPERQPICPTCHVPFSADAQRHYLAEHYAYEAARKKLSGDRLTAKQYLDIVMTQLAEHRSHISACQTMLRQFSDRKSELERLEAQTNTLKITQLELALDDARAAKNPYAILYDENLKRMNLVMGHYNSLKSRVDEMAMEVRSLEFWAQSFNKDLKTELLKQVCPFLEQKSNIHLEALGNPQMKVRFQTTKTLKSTEEKNEFTVTVESSTGGGNYDALSGGEKQMVNFAVGMALADLAESQVDGPSKLSILDEPFMALDQRNSELVVNYLQACLAKKKDTILLVSNEESLKMLIPNQIQVIKEHGITRLEQ